MDVTSQNALDNYLDVTVNEAGNRTANLEARERLHTLAGQVGYSSSEIRIIFKSRN